jgi:hypothetical protein
VLRDRHYKLINNVSRRESNSLFTGVPNGPRKPPPQRIWTNPLLKKENKTLDLCFAERFFKSTFGKSGAYGGLPPWWISKGWVGTKFCSSRVPKGSPRKPPTIDLDQHGGKAPVNPSYTFLLAFFKSEVEWISKSDLTLLYTQYF